MPDAPDNLPPSTPSVPPAATPDPQRDAVVGDETALLEKTHHALASATRRVVQNYDQELIALRDQIAEARLEDVPPLVQQMERLTRIAARRAELPATKIDVRSPYFGHLRLEENGRQRDVLIGNATYIDTERGIRVVDWRDAPVSQLYYRYAEGDDYEEEIAGRTLEGNVLVRRAVVIADGVIRRIIAPQGVYARQKRDGEWQWRTLDVHASKLSGGQGIADRPPALEEYSIRKGRLGVGVAGREDRHLPDIPALIDPRQFQLISKPGSGMVVIQGGAGSGKTTIGLHRLAYLNFNDSKRFAPDRMLVVVFNEALVAYISRVLPSLNVEGVQVATYGDWSARQRRRHLPQLPNEYAEDTPPAVVRMKKHPVMLTLIDERLAREAQMIAELVSKAVVGTPDEAIVVAAWNSIAHYPISQRVTAMALWVEGRRTILESEGNTLNAATRFPLTTALERVKARSRDVVWDWAELITDGKALREGFAKHAPDALSPGEIAFAVKWCADRVHDIVIDRREEEDDENAAQTARDRAARDAGGGEDRDEAEAEVESGESGGRAERRRGRPNDDDDDDNDRDEHDPYLAMDGVNERERPPATLDREDDALLLRLYQRKRGALKRDKKLALLYEHIFVDEAQDLAPIELAVLLDCATPARSITLAGDVAQRLHLDNGFTDWKEVLTRLGYAGVEIEPLKIGYRSTVEVLDFARTVLGPLADPEPPIATRSGAPVEMHRFPDVGAAVAFLGESLRDLALSEPRSSVALITRDPERADLYFEGLKRAEVPRLTRVRSQDFTFKPGVEVTDIRQVKGLEFDYVILVDVTQHQYPANDESRHLLHIGATRAAHQLWVVAVGPPSRLLPEEMRD